MKKVYFTLVAALLMGALQITNAQVRLFTSKFNPNGLAVDNSNNVLVYSDVTSKNELTKFNSSGRATRKINTGSWTSIGEMARMAKIPGSNYMFGIYPMGDLVIIDPSTLQIQKLGNLRATRINTSRVYDMARGRYVSNPSQVLPYRADYGDIDVYVRGSKIYVFITAISVRFPFVVKLVFDNGNFKSADAILTSTWADNFTSGVPRGIAVNKYGTVLTTLPYARSVRGAAQDVGVKFKYNFSSSAKPQYLFNKTDLASRGMTTDKYGNFYIATGSIGSSLAGGNSTGAILKLNSSASRVTGRMTFNVPLLRNTEIAINPSGSTGYFCATNYNQVYSFRVRDLSSANLATAEKETPDLNTYSNAEPFNQGDDISTLVSKLTLTTLPTSTVNTQIENAKIENTQWEAFPNPTTDKVFITIKDEIAQDFQLQVFAQDGRRLFNQGGNIVNGQKVEIDLTAYPAGHYVLRLINGAVVENKIIIKN